MPSTFYDRPLDGPMSYQMGDPTSQGYFDTAARLHEKSLQPAYEQALERTRQSFANRGFGGGGGMEKFAEMGLTQDYMGNLSNQRGQMALRSSDVGEQNRRRVEQRGWQVEDRDKRYQFLRDQEQRMRDDKEAANRSGMIGAIGRGVGTVGGALLGAYLAPPGRNLQGAALGANIGGSIFGGGSVQMPATPSPYPQADPAEADYNNWLMDQYAPQPDMGGYGPYAWEQ